jgi:hypothetical protein
VEDAVIELLYLPLLGLLQAQARWQSQTQLLLQSFWHQQQLDQAIVEVVFAGHTRTGEAVANLEQGKQASRRARPHQMDPKEEEVGSSREQSLWFEESLRQSPLVQTLQILNQREMQVQQRWDQA